MILRFLNRSPLFFICLGFISVSVFMYRITMTSKIIIGAILCVIIAVSLIAETLINRKFESVWAIRLIICGAVAGIIVSALYMNFRLEPVQRRYNGTSAQIEAEVLSSKPSSYGTSAVVRIKSINTENTNIKTKLFMEYPCDAGTGDVISLSVYFEEPEDNINGYREKDYMLSKGIVLCAVSEEDSVSFLGSRIDSPSFFIYRIRSRISSFFKDSFGEDAGGLVSGLMLGDKDSVPDTVKRDFRRLGLSHTLAVSGLHLSVLCGAVALVLKKLKAGRITSFTVMVLTALFIAVLTGAPVSVMRAAIMSMLCWLGFLLGKRGDSVLYLFISVSVILLLRPGAAADAGLWMSFCATFGLLTAAAPINRFFIGILPERVGNLRIIKGIVSIFSASIAAVTCTLPLSWIYFGEISLVAPFSNVIFCYPLMAVLCAAPVVLITAKIPFLSYLIKRIIYGLIGIVTKAAGAMAKSDLVCMSLNYPFTVACAVAGAAVFILLTAITVHYGKMRCIKSFAARILSSLLAASAIFAVCLGIYNFRIKDIADITCFSYSKNDACVVSVNGNSMFIDCSSGGYTGFYRAMTYLSRYNYENSLDCFLITHYHQRHISSFSKAAQNFYIRTLVLPEPLSDSEKAVFLALSQEAEIYGCEVMTYPSSENAKIKFDNLRVEISKREYLDRSAHPVIAYTVSNRSSSFVYAGASAFENESASELCSSAADNASVVYYGIHGPIQKLRPEFTFENARAVRYCASLPYPPDNAKPVDTDLPLRIKLK